MTDPVALFEIPADNMEHAQQFYREAFGWQIHNRYGDPDRGMHDGSAGEERKA